ALIALFGTRLFGRKVREEGARAAAEADPDPEAEQAAAPGTTPPLRAEPPADASAGAPAEERNGLTRRGPLAHLALGFRRTITAVRRTSELAEEQGTAPWRLLVARIAAARAVAIPIAIVTIAALVLAASQVREMKLGLTFIQSLPQQNEVRRAADAAQQGFSPGILAPTELDLEQPGIAGKRAQLARLQQLIGREPGVDAVIGPAQQVQGAPAVMVSKDGGGARYAVVFDKDPLGAGAIDRFTALRDRMPA